MEARENEESARSARKTLDIRSFFKRPSSSKEKSPALDSTSCAPSQPLSKSKQTSSGACGPTPSKSRPSSSKEKSPALDSTSCAPSQPLSKSKQTSSGACGPTPSKSRPSSSKEKSPALNSTSCAPSQPPPKAKQTSFKRSLAPGSCGPIPSKKSKTSATCTSQSAKSKFKQEWREKFLVEYDCTKNIMICMVCRFQFSQIKVDNLKKHTQRKHSDLKIISEQKKKQIVTKFCNEQAELQAKMDTFLGPQEQASQASYKLALFLAQEKMPLSYSEKIVYFAAAADPTSAVFPLMADSRRTVTRRLEDLHEVLDSELQSQIGSAPFWGYLIDETTDKATKEQMAVFVRFIDPETESVTVKFLSCEEIKGRPDAKNIFSQLSKVFETKEMPMEKLVSHTTDNAAVVSSALNGVVGLAQRKWNDKLCLQRCVTHTEVLVAKDGQKCIPASVEKTIKNALDHFKYSAARQHVFEEIALLNGERYRRLVTYHKIRWLSLQVCVERLCQIMTSLAQYFETQSTNRKIKKKDRDCCLSLYNQVSDRKFLLYLFFLKGELTDLSEINIELQKRNQVLYCTYKRIFNFIKTFLVQVVHNNTLKPTELLVHENVLTLDELTVEGGEEVLFGCQEFRDYWKECVENGMANADLRAVANKCLLYKVTIGRRFVERFPEADFVLDNCAFLDPLRRRQKYVEGLEKAIDRFVMPYQGIQKETVRKQYELYVLEDDLDLQFAGQCQQDSVKFHCQLYKDRRFSQFGKLCMLFDTICPDVCEVERAFSNINYTKNVYRTQLTQDHLNALVACSLDDRDIYTFPFPKHQ